MDVAPPGTDREHGSPPPVVRPHFPCFEGLRALAAVLVVVHHAANLSGGRSGFVATPASVMDIGVSIFFVISGFLIYRPFSAAQQAGDPVMSTRRFWWRRVLRIVPAYWLALTFFWVAHQFWPTVGFDLGPEWWRYYLFLQIYDVFTTLGGIVPAWSLNTEMAFYLFIPLWAYLLRRVARGRTRPALELAGAGVLVAAGYVSRFFFSHSQRVWAALPGKDPVTMREVSFSWLPNNIDLFALGMFLAVLSAWSARDVDLARRLDRLAHRPGPYWAAAVALFAWFAYRVGAPQLNGGYQGWYWQQRQLTFGAIAVLLLIPAVFGNQEAGLMRRALRLGPVVWVGMVSYGLYLWHLDWLEAVAAHMDDTLGRAPFVPLFLAGLALGLASAAVSWYGLERPLQRFKRLI